MFEYLFSINNTLFTVPYFDYAVSVVELWSTILGLWCVIAFRKDSMWAYPTGILNSLGFIAIFYQIQLYSDLLLNFYFIGVSVLGWFWWSQKKSDGTSKLKIKYMTPNVRGLWLIGLVAGTYVLGANIDVIFNAMAQFVAAILGTTYAHTPAAMPFWDASTTVMSLAAMFLLTRKYVEAWILWVIVDVICIALYAYRGVMFLSLEYAIFLANAAFAVYQWHKLSKE